MRKLAAIALLLILGANATFAQMPPVTTNFFALTDLDANTNESPFSNETSTTSNRCLLTWTPPTNPVTAYHLYWGRSSRVYTRMLVLAGTSTSYNYPPLAPPAPTTIWQESIPFLSSTNLLAGWTTNRAVLNTVTGALPTTVKFYRTGDVQWLRIQ